jgi:hypothetical protein
LKLKANPLRVNKNWVPWTDEEIAFMIRVYGANLKSINSLFAYPDSPNSRVNAHLEAKTNHINLTLNQCKGCKTLIKDVLNNGSLQLSEGIDMKSMEVLIESNILAMIDRKYMFHSRIVERAAEGIYGSQ